jgi:hypothetical protein
MSGRFDLNDYVTVDERIDRFWADHPEGRILTGVAWVAADGSSVAVLASVYADRADDKPAATGLAQEERGGGRGPVNSSSWWENCETSAIGRALANLGMSLSKNRPSREEMAKVERYEQQPTPRAGSAGPGREAPAPRRSAAPTDRPAAVPSAAGPPSAVTPAEEARLMGRLDKVDRHYNAPGKPTAEELEELSAADFGWTEFWSWARQRGYSDRTSLDAAVGRSTKGMTPVEIRAALRKVAVPA